MKIVAITFLLLALFSSGVFGGERAPIIAGPKDKCPVCGMFVKKYPDWVAQVIFKDGSYAVFDGSKDMFRYLFDLKKYNPRHKAADIDSVYVTDYYGLRLIDGYAAAYVIGSDVYGPMGRELIPFAKVEDARVFMKDHKGKTVLTFGEITPAVVKGLD
jgi:copper chaperone NosL